MNRISGYGLLLILLTGACYRPETRELVLQIPDAKGNIQELDALKRVLLTEQDQLRDGLVFYEEIRVNTEASALEITYNRAYLADMNLVHKINQLGYRIGDLPGDSEKRAAFRKRMNLP